MKKCKFMMAILGAIILFSPILAEDLDESSGESSAPVASSGVPKPGNGVSTFFGGSSAPDGVPTLVLNYNFFSTTHTQGARVYRNMFVPVLRVGVGKQWDISLQVPMNFTIQNGKRTTNGAVGRATLWAHKQHLAEKFGDSMLMVATSYSVSIPTSSGMNGFWGFGFGVGLTWNYLSHRLIFDFNATANTNKNNPDLFIKAGYHYAFNDYLYTGLELNWDTVPYKNLYNGYSKDGSHTLYIGPMLSVKIPELHNSAWGVGFFWDVVNQYQNSAQKVKWKEAWRLTSRITASF